MAAHHHLNPNQMRMFMRPGEIKEHIAGSVDHEDVGKGATWTGKQNDFLRNSIQGSGVKTPVILTPAGSESARRYINADVASGGGVVMGNGHHRVENAHRAEQATGRQVYVPVLHDEEYMGTSQAMRKSYPTVHKAGGGI